MKTILATLVLGLALAATALPASAAYQSPGATWQEKALSNGY